MYTRHGVTLAPSFRLFVRWSLMGILKEWELHGTEGLMARPIFSDFVFSPFLNDAISVLGCKFTDCNIWF